MPRPCLRSLLALAPVAAIVAFLPAARATLLRMLDLPELVAAADRVVVGDVRSLHAAWDEAHRSIYTTVEVDVRETWKGPSAGSEAVTIRQLGGSVGDIEMTVYGMPRFAPGERALLFLHGTRVVGMEQGKRTLRWEPKLRRWLVSPADRAAARLSPLGRTRSAEPEAAEDLDSLRARIRKLVGK